MKSIQAVELLDLEINPFLHDEIAVIKIQGGHMAFEPILLDDAHAGMTVLHVKYDATWGGGGGCYEMICPNQRDLSIILSCQQRIGWTFDQQMTLHRLNPEFAEYDDNGGGLVRYTGSTVQGVDRAVQFKFQLTQRQWFVVQSTWDGDTWSNLHKTLGGWNKVVIALDWLTENANDKLIVPDCILEDQFQLMSWIEQLDRDNETPRGKSLDIETLDLHLKTCIFFLFFWGKLERTSIIHYKISRLEKIKIMDRKNESQ